MTVVGAAPAAQAAGDRIWFVRVAADAHHRVMSVHADGTGLRTEHVDGFWTTTRVAVSPGGDRMALVQFRFADHAGGRLVTMDARGGGAATVVVPRGAGAANAPRECAWSPDGTRLLFTRDRLGEEVLFTVRPDGSGLRRIRTGGLSVEAFTIAPGGGRIAFVDGSDRLMVQRIDGSERHVVVPRGQSRDPEWAPDGRTIAFGWSGSRSRRADLFAITPDGRTLTRLTHSAEVSESDPTWSPDGTRIAFVRWRGGGWNPQRLWTMRRDGTGRERVPTGAASASWPDWASA
jgi:TolB protein